MHNPLNEYVAPAHHIRSGSRGKVDALGRAPIPHPCPLGPLVKIKRGIIQWRMTLTGGV
jgi:hypothetical protein